MIEVSTNLAEVNLLYALGLLLGAAAVDALYATYTIKVVEGKAFSAASLSLITYFIEVAGTISFLGNIWYLLPLGIGAFAGTFLAVERENRRKRAGRKRPKAKV